MFEPNYTLNMNSNDFFIRDPNDSDVLKIFEWRNDPLTIAYSRTGRGVEFREHLEWFAKVCVSSNIVIQIAVQDKDLIGISIFTYFSELNYFEISINISPEFRNLGLGKNLISLSEEKLKNDKGSCTIRAMILENNYDSIIFFEKCNYYFVQKNRNILIYEKILH